MEKAIIAAKKKSRKVNILKKIKKKKLKTKKNFIIEYY